MEDDGQRAEKTYHHLKSDGFLYFEALDAQVALSKEWSVLHPSIRRIMIADDHQAMREGVRTLLECQTHWKVVGEASDGRQALHMAQDAQPDIAILDYSLPRMNGLELTRAIKREVPKTEILIYTMHDRESIMLDVFRAGARGFVLKSESSSHLMDAVSALSVHKTYCSRITSDKLLGYLTKGDQSAGHPSVLTSREREIVQLISEGELNKQVAHILDISVKTVETHRASIMNKLGIRTTAEMVLYAVRNGIIDP